MTETTQPSALTRFRAQLLAAGRSDISRRFAKLFGWTATATAFDRAAALGAIFLSARLVDAESFGRWSAAQSTVIAMQVFILVGGTTVISKFVPQLKTTLPRDAAETVRMTFMVTAVIIAALATIILVRADSVTEYLFKQSSDSQVVALLAGWLCVTGLGSLLAATCTAFEDGRAIAGSSLVAGLLSIIAIPTAAITYGYVGMLIAVVVAELARCILLGIAVASKFNEIDQPLIGGVSIRSWRRFATFGIPLFAQSALYAPVLWVGQMMVLQRNTNGLIEIGAFNFAMLFFAAILVVTTRVNQATMPLLSSLAGNHELARLARVAQTFALLQLVVALLIAAPIAVAAPLITPAALSWPTLSVVAMAGAAVALQTALANALLVVDRQWTVLASIVPWAVIFLSITWGFSESAGALALANGLLLAGFVRTSIILGAWLHWRSQTTPSTRETLS